MSRHEKINYLEFPAKDLLAVKKFFSKIFSWEFVDYGPEYAAFTSSSAGVDGGFFQSDLASSTTTGAVLVVLYSDELEKTKAKIEPAGGSIVKDIFSFPGGRRFHFSDPSGNEYAVWSEV